MSNSLPFSAKLLLRLNKLFRPTEHPFNESCDSYSDWQFSKAPETLACFSGYIPPQYIINEKTVLDVGCGAAGKSVYYAVSGAKSVVGCDSFDYAEAAVRFAEKHGAEDKFRFVQADAASLPFDDGSFDTVIMSDLIEHARDTAGVLNEAFRVCKPKGRIFINFTSYRHPRGAHLSDAINVPWCQYLFSEKALVAAYRSLISDAPDREYREELKLNESKTHIDYINRITIRKFDKILKREGIDPVYKARIPLRRIARPFSHLPLTGECLTHSAVYVFEK